MKKCVGNISWGDILEEFRDLNQQQNLGSEEIPATRKFWRQGNSGNEEFPVARKLRRIRRKGYSGGEEIQAAIVSRNIYCETFEYGFLLDKVLGNFLRNFFDRILGGSSEKLFEICW